MSGVHAVTQARDDADQPRDQRLQDKQAPAYVGEPIPAVCHIADVCRIFQISRTTFYARRRSFEKFLLTGSTSEWSGYRIAKHLTGGSFAITVKRS